MDFFQDTGFKESNNMVLKKCQGNNKLSRKVMSFSYHIEWKTFIEASFTNNIHTREKTFCNCHFEGL